MKASGIFKTLFAAAFLAANLATAVGAQQFVDAASIDLTQRHISGTLWLVDVRMPREFDAKHIEGAVNIPAFALAEKNLPKSDRIIVYCNDISGRTSRIAAQRLLAQGYSNVGILKGGLLAWETAKRPLAMPTGIVDLPLVDYVSASDLLEAQETGLSGVQLIDLRPREEFGKNAIQGAMNIPIPQVKGSVMKVKGGSPLLQQLSLRKGDHLVLVDGGTGVAQDQAELLRRQGVKGVRFLEGGMAAWENAVARKQSRNPIQSKTVTYGP